MTKFKQTDIGLIPDDWEIESLGNLQSERLPSINPGDFENEEFEYYSIPAYQDGGIPFTEKGMNIQSTKLLLKEGSVLFGKLNPRVEKVWRVKSHTKLRKIGSTEWIPILPKDNADSNFLYFVEWSDYIMPKAKQLVSGSTPSRQRVDPPSFYKLIIPLPPLPEQKKIAHVLSKIQQAIKTQEQIIITTQELKKALMQKLFTEGLNGEPQKQTEIGLIPESWEVKQLSEIADDFIGGGTPSTSKSEYWDGDIHWTTSKRLDAESIYLVDGEKRISKLGLDNSATHLIPKNNLIISTRVTVGKIAINKIDIAISQDLTGLFIDQNKYSLEFLAYSIYTERVQKIFDAQKRGATIKGITRDDLKEIKIAIPQINTQKIIANIFSDIDSKIFIHKNAKVQLTELFKTMLSQLMTGQIRVKNFGFNLE